MKKIDPSHFCKLAEQRGIIPNFYLSEAYLTYAKAETLIIGGYAIAYADGWSLFPPINLGGIPVTGLELKIWTDFKNTPQIELKNKTFFDFEYIYDSTHFNDLSGKKWTTFRKNVRKWPRRHQNSVYSYILNLDEIKILLADWLLDRIDSILDGEFIIEYITNGIVEEKVRCMGLYLNKELVGLNVWDENYRFLNYRFCIAKPNEPFLDEYLRYLFYTNKEVQTSGKLINDGGSLGSKGLERFKDKLNYIEKREVHSWKFKN